MPGVELHMIAQFHGVIHGVIHRLARLTRAVDGRA